mgnify:FL=1|tara:strand:+ start:232 stop:615 length:384 start_codon:yes stop_codon:yes gene_type:complete
MISRAIVTSAIFTAIFGYALTYLTSQILESTLLTKYLLLWGFSFLSILAFVYGRKITRNFKSETGKIKWFDPSKGYGFLIRDKGGDLFVHLRSVKPDDRRKLREDTRVRFSVEETEKGPQAERIRII